MSVKLSLKLQIIAGAASAAQGNWQAGCRKLRLFLFITTDFVRIRFSIRKEDYEIMWIYI
jgi:hypothetical protein